MFVHVFSDKTVTTLMSTANGANPVVVVLLNGFVVHGRWLVESGISLVGFLPAKKKMCRANGLTVRVGASAAHY